MAWIRTVDPADARGLLGRIYDAAMRRAGRVYNIIRIQSPRPRVLRASTQLYLEVMRSRDSGLSRAQREMIATTVSQLNGCFYWTRAHADDLRDEVADRPGGAALADAVARDYREAELAPADRAMLDFAAKLTGEPASIEPGDLDRLRAHGFDDAAIHDIVQVTALFSYYNRLGDGLGVESEPDW